MSLFGTFSLDPEQVLRKTPGPAPWYLRASSLGLANVTSQDSTEIEPNSGATLLTKLDGEVLALVGMYCYVKALDEDRFVVWYQGYDSKLNSHKNTIDFHFLKITDLKPFEDVKASLKMLSDEARHFIANTDEGKSFSLSTHLEPGIHSIDLVSEFDFTDEFLLWGHSTSESFIPRWGKNNDLCLFIIRQQYKTLEVIPQDWFNNSDSLDFGYQWVTRVARDSQTQKVVGDGIRISRFVLDDSLKEVEKWFDDDPYFRPGK